MKEPEIEVLYTENPSIPVEQMLDSRRCIGSPDRNILYWGIEKCAFTSTSEWLRQNGFRNVNGVISDYDLHFTILREPYRRYVSALGTIHRSGLVADVEWEAYIKGVNDYIRRNYSVWSCGGNEHFRQQRMVFGKMPNASVRFRMEDLSKLGDWLGIDTPFPRRNTGDVNKIDYALEALRPSRDIILDYYAQDLVAWQYVSMG